MISLEVRSFVLCFYRAVGNGLGAGSVAVTSRAFATGAFTHMFAYV